MDGNIWIEYEKRKKELINLPRAEYEIALDKLLEELEIKYGEYYE